MNIKTLREHWCHVSCECLKTSFQGTSEAPYDRSRNVSTETRSHFSRHISHGQLSISMISKCVHWNCYEIQWTHFVSRKCSRNVSTEIVSKFSGHISSHASARETFQDAFHRFCENHIHSKWDQNNHLSRLLLHHRWSKLRIPVDYLKNLSPRGSNSTTPDSFLKILHGENSQYLKSSKIPLRVSWIVLPWNIISCRNIISGI